MQSRPPVEDTQKEDEVMDASHILVGGLTAIAIALLVWIEIRSRRNAALPEYNRHHRNETAGAERGNDGRMGADCGNRARSGGSCSRWLHLSMRSLPEVRSASAR